MNKRFSFGSPSLKGHYPALAVLVLALVLRLLHVASVPFNPLNYQPGPEEDYYLRFARALSTGIDRSDAGFSFLDPGYGYLLGGVFRLVGDNAFFVYLLQALLDTATVLGILIAGAQLKRPRAGLYGALLYAVTPTAIMFCTALTRSIWVTAFATWWVVQVLALGAGARWWRYPLLGIYCGLGVAIWWPLALLGVVTVLSPALLPAFCSPRAGWTGRAVRSSLILAGAVLALLPLGVRNDALAAGLSPWPTGIGITLHQIYNEQNPTAGPGSPDFVKFDHPNEVWRDYRAEAIRRLGRTVTARQIDGYWWTQGFAYIAANPLTTLENVLRKNMTWISSAELPDERRLGEERLFSAVLRYLPAPGVWLLPIGIVGLLWLLLEDRRAILVAAPVVLAWTSAIVWLPQSHIRVQAASLLALGGGILVDQFVVRMKASPSAPTRSRRALAFGAFALAMVWCAFLIGRTSSALPVRWGRIAWGYDNMAAFDQAQAAALAAIREQPADVSALEVLGDLAQRRGRYDEAEHYLHQAITAHYRSPMAHNILARVYLFRRRHDAALAEAGVAFDLDASADNESLLKLLAKP